MRVIVTCGPSYEPIDFVRRLTNFSTGELGLMLAAALARAGHTVLCLKGIGATAHVPAPRVEIIPFSTNDDLVWKLSGYAGKADGLFHTAALCDYRVQSIQTPSGEEVSAMGKVPTKVGDLVLRLEPTTKVLPQLRGLFPAAKLVGWKYETQGSRPDVLAKAEQQLADCKTDACVVNGSGWGDGFGFVTRGVPPVPIPDKAALCDFLTAWLSQPASQAAAR
jgi:phosphopantothenoylcysteine synthetase/decarboxylase